MRSLNNKLHGGPGLPGPVQVGSRSRPQTTWIRIRRHSQLYLVLLLPFLYLIVFKYVPMAGIVIAFKDYSVIKGIWGSPWAGFKYFEQFLNPQTSGSTSKIRSGSVSMVWPSGFRHRLFWRSP